MTTLRGTRGPLARVLTAILFTGAVAACDDATAPNAEPDLPFPTQVEQDGLRFGLYTFIIDDRLVSGAWVENLTDTTVERDFPGGCMVTNLAAFREGEFDEPVWKSWEVPELGVCSTDAQPIRLFPGQIDFPRGWRGRLPIEFIVGDSLETGSYRLAAFRVQVRPRFSELGDPVTVEMIAPNPVRLER